MQLTMFDVQTHAAKARQWMNTNSDAFDLFCKLAMQYSRGGARKIGAKFIAELLRWQMESSWDFQQEFKINNNWIAEIARAAAEKYPALKDAFEFREHEG